MINGSFSLFVSVGNCRYIDEPAATGVDSGLRLYAHRVRTACEMLIVGLGSGSLRPEHRGLGIVHARGLEVPFHLPGLGSRVGGSALLDGAMFDVG